MWLTHWAEVNLSSNDCPALRRQRGARELPTPPRSQLTPTKRDCGISAGEAGTAARAEPRAWAALQSLPGAPVLSVFIRVDSYFILLHNTIYRIISIHNIELYQKLTSLHLLLIQL